ncbi:ThiF family adenylyltransferase [uncultured Desulfuromusa sp.]|uniref:ThiF family adenylyltransferase n=1 Tax=uncultured Desulfuromusa sp. TaxID=219183 RepID=UPI002AA9177F|nr:ThiF family adenylyltransferase [uncultured Desulfuromusa sp.]
MSEPDRYNRQILHWGQDRQQQLEAATVLIAGIGGLGAIVSQLLVRAGIGKLYLVDDGLVDWSDLNRQLLYSETNVGQPKLTIAKRKLEQINTNVKIELLPNHIGPGFRPPEDAVIIADCLDNYPSRFSLEAGLKNGSYLVHGGIEGNQGQVLTLQKGKSQPLQDIFTGCRQPQGDIPVTGAGATILSGFMTHEICNTIFSQPQLLNRFLIVGLSDLHLTFLEV